jgi:peroxiredoxin Q/BCP
MRPGDPVVDFELPDETGTPRRLSELAGGRPAVVFFYPAAMTYGCTREACGFRDHRSDFDRLGAAVIGVSADPVEKLGRFAQSHGFGFPLLSDPDGEVAARYGARRLVPFFGHRRLTVVIGADGTVLDVFRSELSFAAHAERAVRALQAAAGAA